MNDLTALPMFRTMGRVLLHSLWQGAALALLAWAALHLARHRSAEVRYALASGALGLLVLTFAGTLVRFVGSGGPATVADAILPAVAGDRGGLGSWLTWARAALGHGTPWLVLAWLLGFSFRVARMGWAMAWLYGPCLRGLQPPPSDWLARFEALRVRSGIRFPVRLELSSRVDSLLVLGWLKPLVLVPAAALMALPPDALEALLVHELAHIRRRDFLANLLQTLAEALLFYHPAVWWLSRRVRQEREHCCDDAAVRTCGDPLLYASALLGLEELRTRPDLIPDLAPAASGGKLMSRIQRILRPCPAHNPAAPLAALLPVLLLAAALGAATLMASDVSKAVPATQEPVEVSFKKIRVKHQPPAPSYPPEAKAQRIQGTVVVVVTIGTDGKVTEAHALSGPPELQPCAVDYARSWEFEPAKVKGKSVPARFKLTMPFRLR